MPEFATSKIVYRELRSALAPWCKEAGFRRDPRHAASWHRTLDDDRAIRFGFECSSFGGAAQGGNSFHGEIQLFHPTRPVEPDEIDRYPKTEISRCLVRAELDDLQRIHSRINTRRPLTPQTGEWVKENSLLGRGVRRDYEAVFTPYEEGQYVDFSYFSAADVQELAQFLATHLPAVVQRFVEGRCPPPVYKAFPDEWRIARLDIPPHAG